MRAAYATQPTADAFPQYPIRNAVKCNPKRTFICRCGSETDLRCSRCRLPICDLTVRECAWHHCPNPKEKLNA